MRNGSIRAEIKVDIANPLREEWMDEGACTQVMPDTFFIKKGDSSKPAKTICNGCDVIEQCFSYIMDIEKSLCATKRFGIWAATSPSERYRIAKQRGEEIDDEFAESDGEREDQPVRALEPLLPEEEEDDWSDM